MKDYGQIGTTKTYEQRRVPVPAFLRERLAELVANHSPADPLFKSPEGARLDVDNFRLRIFNPGVARARDAWNERHRENEPFPDVRPHGLHLTRYPNRGPT